MSNRNTLQHTSRRLLARRFESVPLGFKLLGGPLVPSSPEIFQMDIYRSRRFGEYFRIWPGAGDNEIKVLDVEPEFSQILLKVHEPKRRFIQAVPKSPWTTRKSVSERAKATGGSILEERRHWWLLELFTPDEERFYLCGRDDLYLFIAQVDKVRRVLDAHEALKPDEVREAEVRNPGRTSRQGEWFFIPPRREEIEQLKEYVSEHPKSLKRFKPIGLGGKPHLAEKLVRLDRRFKRGRREHRRLDVYVRGSVEHSDHRTLRLATWQRAVRNRELIPVREDRTRLRWID